tara:strand:+ start:6683 stop:7396 length:714 start_codon:yes stop_codon:yes gene_type:complete
MGIYNHIPLNEDFNNWWYFGRRKALSYKINKYSKVEKEKMNILEIGPGTGTNILELQNFGKVDILEIDEYFIELISKNKQLRINNIFNSFKEINKTYDLVVILDVLEHVENTKIFLDDIYSILENNGVLIISVPAHESLFSEHDILLKHYKRYSKKTLKDELKDIFFLKEFFWYNFLLFPIRYIQIKFSKNTNSDTSVGSLLNFVLKLIIKIELIFIKFGIKTPAGISLFCVATKKE